MLFRACSASALRVAPAAISGLSLVNGGDDRLDLVRAISSVVSRDLLSHG